MRAMPARAGDAKRGGPVTFRAMRRDDLPLLHEWLARPHVAEWWDGVPTLVELENDYGPALDGRVALWCYIAYEGDTPVGFLQSNVAAASHADGWWLDEHDPGVHGIDQFLADGDRLGRGLGTRMVRAFVDRLFEDPAVTRVQTDPSPGNRRAIRCYEKAGFRAVREIDTPDGRALLMYQDRPA